MSYVFFPEINVPSANKALPEPILTQRYVTVHMVSPGHNELMTLESSGARSSAGKADEYKPYTVRCRYSVVQYNIFF